MEVSLVRAVVFLSLYLKFSLCANYEEDSKNSAIVEDKQLGYVPHGPLVKCSFL